MKMCSVWRLGAWNLIVQKEKTTTIDAIDSCAGEKNNKTKTKNTKDKNVRKRKRERSNCKNV